MSLLSATHLAKAYKSRQVVRDLSLEVRAGEVVGLLGPNGAGKTTAFYMIVGLVECDTGQILLDERDVTRLPMHRRAQLGIGYLPQEASVFRRLSVEDNILAILETRADLDAAGREARTEELLEELRIGHVRRSTGMALSGGERRRVEIARALAAEPRFILLDEPFAGVNAVLIAEIVDRIRELHAGGVGFLIIEHDLEAISDLVDEMHVLNRGMLLASGAPQAVLDDARVREAYLGGAVQ